METRARQSGAWSAALWLVAAVAAALALPGCGEKKDAPKKEDELYREAHTAEFDRKNDVAIAKYTESLEVKPTHYAYFARGYLYARLNQDKEAMADAEAGLALDPESRDLKWLVGQLKKPPAARFKGKDALPPSSSK